MSYAVKEIVYTLQGEGAQAGRAAVFCRFAGCNLWTGQESDRATATCQFCDTDFVGTDGPGGGKFASAIDLAAAIESCWRPAPGNHSTPSARPLVVFTGGEPALQLDVELIDRLHVKNFEVAIETNGTLELPRGIDWICVSPKAGTTLKIDSGDEIKLIYPQPGAEPERFAELAFEHFYLQPLDSPDRAANSRATVDYCLAHPQWRISLQTHKILGIP